MFESGPASGPLSTKTPSIESPGRGLYGGRTEMIFWLQSAAAVFMGIAAVVSFIRYGKTKNKGQLFISCALLLAASIFGYLAFNHHL